MAWARALELRCNVCVFLLNICRRLLRRREKENHELDLLETLKRPVHAQSALGLLPTNTSHIVCLPIMYSLILLGLTVFMSTVHAQTTTTATVTLGAYGRGGTAEYLAPIYVPLDGEKYPTTVKLAVRYQPSTSQSGRMLLQAYLVNSSTSKRYIVAELLYVLPTLILT